MHAEPRDECGRTDARSSGRARLILDSIAQPASAGAETVHIEAFFDEATNSVSYLVADPASGQAAIIDPVLGFDAASGSIDTALGRPDSRRRGRARLDHRMGARDSRPCRPSVGGASCRGRRPARRSRSAAASGRCSRTFAPLFGADDVEPDGGDFDRLLDDGDRLQLGESEVEVIATPGHTPACVSYRIGDAVFVGDTLFMPDYGTARCDFPGGDARQLYRSMQRILSLPRETRLFLCHDYKAPGRDALCLGDDRGEQARPQRPCRRRRQRRRITSPCGRPATRRSSRPSCSIRRSR